MLDKIADFKMSGVTISLKNMWFVAVVGSNFALKYVKDKMLKQRNINFFVHACFENIGYCSVHNYYRG
jgi:hypothetical protein